MAGLVQLGNIWPGRLEEWRRQRGLPVVDRLTWHFIERWRERAGVPPSLEDVNRMIDERLKIRHQMTVYRLRRGGFEPYKMLAEYWNNRLGIIIKVDEDVACAVTVITAECMVGKTERR